MAKAILEERRATLLKGSDARWYNDPVGFSREGVGIDPWGKQAEVMASVSEHDSNAVRSGHKTGKSMLVALVCLWWVFTRPLGRVLVTSSSYQQVKTVIWAELRRLALHALRHGTITLPVIPKDPLTGVRWPDGRYIIGLSTDQPVNLGGYGGPHMLYAVDEASGVDDGIFDVLEGIRAGGARDSTVASAKILLTGNPTQTTGQFYRAFHQERGIWRPHHISSEDSPNVAAGKVVIPGLATRDYIEERKRAWGEDSDRYRVRVKGDFPRQGPQAVIALTVVEKASARAETSKPDGGRLIIGLDVARFGDDRSVAYPRRGNHSYVPRVVQGHDTSEVAGMALGLARELRQPGDEPALINVDDIGVGGGVTDKLQDASDVEVVGINVATKSDDEDEFPNLRSQLWFAGADWLAEGGALPADQDLRMQLEGELLAPEYKFDARGRRVVEPKDKTKSRLGRSPDIADAFCLACYQTDTDRTIYRVPSRYS